MAEALSLCPSSVSFKGPVGLMWSQSASSQLQAPIFEYIGGCIRKQPGLHITALRREGRKNDLIAMGLLETRVLRI